MEQSLIPQKVPTLAMLHEDLQTAFKNDEYNTLVNQPPHFDWLKKHPLTKGDYLPIEKVEFMLTRIFQKWHIEVLRFDVLFQSVAVHVRLHYYNPYVTPAVWMWQDGLGAAPVQTDAGKSAADLASIKSSAIQIALPSAESYATKDAAEKIGILFGRNLNRKDTLMFAGAFGDNPPVASAPTTMLTAALTTPKQYTQADIHAANANYTSPAATIQPTSSSFNLKAL
jgi:hypothetical protein